MHEDAAEPPANIGRVMAVMLFMDQWRKVRQNCGQVRKIDFC